MFNRRRIPLAVTTALCLLLASGASADPLDTFTGAATPAHVKPTTSVQHTISLTIDPLAPDRAQRATIAIPAGFTVDPGSVQATTTAVPASCDAATWEPDGELVANGKINLRRSGADTNALCAGATLTVAVQAASAAAEGTYAWTSELLNDVSGAFTLVGPQPSVVVDGTPPTATITGKPGDPSSDSGPSFVFSADEPSTFECKLDGAAFVPCSSPQTYAALGDGNHSFAVRATDTAGNAGLAASHSWRIDTAAPTATIASKPANPSSSTGASFSFTASESGSSFSCRLDGGAVESCVSPKTYTGLGDGQHAFQVRAIDQAGNAGTADAYAWTVDTVGPTAAITGKPTNPSRDSSPSFAFTANEAGSTFSCRLDTQALASCVSVKSYSGLADGAHTFSVRAMDAATNNGPITSYEWTIDTVAPTATITGQPSNPTNNTTATFTFTASEAGSAFACQLDAAALASCSSPVSYTGLADGPHTFRVRATDQAGNAGAGETYTWRVDTVAPTTAIALKPSDPSSDTSPRFGFTASENGSQFACKLDAAAFNGCVSPITYSNASEGLHTFSVRATDLAGNVGTATTYSWTIDTTAPTATITQTPSDPSNNKSPTFAFNGGDATDFQCKLDLAAPTACTSPQTYSALADGRHVFVVRAKDAAGNTSAEASFTWTIDTVAPTTSISGKPTSPSNTSSPSFAFTASENGSTFLCRLDGQAFSACDSPKSYTGLGQGPHTFGVKATDRAGNAGAEATHTWTVDTIAPTTSVTGPSNPSTTSSASFTFTASESGSSFSCRLDGEAFAPCASPKSYTGLVDGSHTFAVRATDAAGNQGSPTQHTWTIDTTPPTAAITDKPNNPTNESVASFSFAAEAGSSFTCKIDSAAFAPCTSPKTYTGLTDGSHTFAVRATDALGNAGPIASYSWTIDTVAPSVQVTQKPSSPSNVKSPSFAFTSSESGSTFACRLEQGGFTPCTSPKSYSTLPDGQHAFAVKATDLAGNTGAAATYTWTIDTIAPAASITGKPANPSNNRSPSFAFTANEEGSTFACRLDGGSSAACSAPFGYDGLADGPHTFAVMASDPAGNTGPETTYAWTIETRGPTAALISTPSGLSNSSTASFAFSADEPSSFECKVDARAFEPCSSPATYHALGDGTHAFSVRAKDAVGNLSAPVGRSWAIDTTAPETTLASAPKSGTATSAAFAFAASESGTFECRLDAGQFALCSSTKSYAGLARGDHQFQVRAIDAAGNADVTPSLHRWKIEAPAVKTARSALLAPSAGKRVTKPPLLAWRRVARAGYYNVQLYRGSRKVFTGWPIRTRIQLRSTWKYLGRKQRLLPGVYRWYVWPGFGTPSARRYGALLGQSTFVVVRRKK